jgi:hypothetical protein
MLLLLVVVVLLLLLLLLVVVVVVALLVARPRESDWHRCRCSGAARRRTPYHWGKMYIGRGEVLIGVGTLCSGLIVSNCAGLRSWRAAAAVLARNDCQ